MNPAPHFADWPDEAQQMLLYAVKYCGPWQRLSDLFDGIGFDRTAIYCQDRELSWLAKHVQSGTTPSERWRVR